MSDQSFMLPKGPVRFTVGNMVKWQSRRGGAPVEITGVVIRVIKPLEFIPRIISEELAKKFTFTVREAGADRRTGYAYVVLVRPEEGIGRKLLLYVPVASRLQTATEKQNEPIRAAVGTPGELHEVEAGCALSAQESSPMETSTTVPFPVDKPLLQEEIP